MLFYRRGYAEMTCTNQQVLLLRKNLMTYNQKTSAAKSGMCSKTARKYTKSQKLPRDLKSSRDWSTRSDPFEKTWGNYSARKYFQKTRRFSLTPFFEKTQHSYGT